MNGSLVNALSGTPKDVVPTVGMGATELCWSDRHAYTVIAVSPTGKTVTVQADRATRTDKNGMSESQEYSFEPNPQGQVYHLRLTKKGWAYKGIRFALGYRSEYHDFSF